eukprot:gene15755-19960_t
MREALRECIESGGVDEVGAQHLEPIAQLVASMQLDEALALTGLRAPDAAAAASLRQRLAGCHPDRNAAPRKGEMQLRFRLFNAARTLVMAASIGATSRSVSPPPRDAVPSSPEPRLPLSLAAPATPRASSSANSRATSQTGSPGQRHPKQHVPRPASPPAPAPRKAWRQGQLCWSLAPHEFGSDGRVSWFAAKVRTVSAEGEVLVEGATLLPSTTPQNRWRFCGTNGCEPWERSVDACDVPEDLRPRATQGKNALPPTDPPPPAGTDKDTDGTLMGGDVGTASEPTASDHDPTCDDARRPRSCSQDS